MDERYVLKERKKLKRAFIFWDHANIFYILQELNIRINYEFVKSRLARGYHLVAPVMYLGKPRVVYPKKQKFFDILMRQGWSIIETPLKIHVSGKTTQNGVEDVMFLDIYDFAKEGAYEKAIIVSGNSAFVGVVKELKKLGVDVEVWSFKISLSKALIAEVGPENVNYFDDVMEDITLLDYSPGRE
ncbi:MAG: NYN domain-containing protein [Promethearchaeota archaeon]